MSATATRPLSRGQLDQLYRNSPPGKIPDGKSEGTALFLPGTAFNGPMATMVRRLAWQGKVFDAQRGELRNRVSPFGFLAIKARVYLGSSRLDGKQSVILD